jgi:hypothetical protein
MDTQNLVTLASPHGISNRTYDFLNVWCPIADELLLLEMKMK